MQNPSHSSKRLPTTKNSIYDDVFGRAPRKITLAPRVEDYAEIFGGFHASRASSIPFLDLPTASASSSPPFEVRALSRLEYYDVFGGFDDHDFALSYEEMVRMMMGMGGESNGPDGFSASDTDDAWTMSGSGYLSEESHVKNQCLSNGNSSESIDGDMEFNISYSKASQRSNEALSNGRLVPEYSFVVDRGNSLSKTSVGDCQPFELSNGHLDTRVSGELRTGKLFCKTMSQPAYGTAHTSSHGHPLKHQKDYSRNISFPNEAFLTISDVSLRTRPSNLPPPSRQPPAVHVKKVDSGKLRSNTDSLGFEGGSGDSSPPYFDVDINLDSSAVASAAAMKEAMEKAQAKLKSAKDLLAKKREINRRSKRLGSKKNGKGEKLAQPFDSSGMSDEIVQITSGGKENKEEFCVKQNIALTPHSSPGSPEGIDQDLTEKSAENKHGGGSLSSQGPAEMDRAGEWQEANQYYELVKMDKRRKPIDQLKNDNVWVQSTNVHEFEKKGKKATFMGTSKSKLLENMHTFEDASGWDEDSKESRVNLHATDTENEQARANKLQSESFDGLVHINNQTKVVNVKQKGREQQLREADLCLKGGTIEAQMCLGVVGDEEKIKVALEHAENARRYIQAFEQEEKRSYGKKQEAFEREEKEMRHKEVLEFEESKRQDGILEKEPNNRKFEVTLENSKIERRWKEAVEREENEKREKDVHTRKEKEKWLKETVEKEKERRKRETVEQEESEKRQRDAREREGNEKRLEEILEREKSERRIKDAASREENEKKQRGSHETEETKMLRAAVEQEDSKKRLEDVCEQEEYDNKNAVPPEREGTKKRGEEPFDKEEVQRRTKVLGSKGIGKALDDANEKEQSLKGSKEGDYEIGVKKACELQESGNIIQQNHKKQHVTGNDVTLKGPSTIGLNPGAMCSDIKLDGASNLLGTQLRDEGQRRTGKSDTECGKEESMKRLVEMKVGEMDGTSGMVDEMFCGKTVSTGMVQGNMGDEANELPLEDSVGLSCMAGDVKKAGEGGIAIEQKNVEEIKIASPLDFDEKKVEREKSEKISQESNVRGKSTENGQVISNHGDVRDNSSPAKVKEGDEMGKKKGVSHFTILEVKESIQRTAQHASPGQVGERKVKNLNATLSSREQESEMMMREKELEQERQRKLEEEREREREREKDRMAVDGPKFEGRGFSESLERVERAAVERMMNEARERLEKACAEAREKSMTDKMAMEARLRAERAAVERATAEARERAFQKAMAERATFEMKDRVEGSIADHLSASSRSGIRPSSSSYDQQDMPSRNAGMLGSLRSQNLSHHSGPKIVERSGVIEGESPQRCKARLERHRRTAERAAKALAEKNMRDLLAQREQAERNRLAETLDADVRRWSTGKEGNLRALLSTLQYILGPDSGWQPVPLTEVITAAAVKKAYRKATLSVHPDKLQQRGASVQQKYICEKVFDLLKAYKTKKQMKSQRNCASSASQPEKGSILIMAANYGLGSCDA